MRYLVISDIHGSLLYTKKILEAFEREKCDGILCLGDILYHGPRNDLPVEYNPKEVANLLNQYQNKIIAVRGNCESEVDQMVLNFPIHESAVVVNEGVQAIMTHGHVYGPQQPINISRGIVFYGHTHVSKIEKLAEVFYVNPGSISIPKNNTVSSYAIFEPKLIQIKDLDGQLIMEQVL